MTAAIDRVKWTQNGRRGYVTNHDPETHVPHLEGVEWHWRAVNGAVSRSTVFVPDDGEDGPVEEPVRDPVEEVDTEPEPVEEPRRPSVTVKRERPSSKETWEPIDIETVRPKRVETVTWWQRALAGREDLSAADVRLLMFISTYADFNYPFANARPGQAELAAACGLTTSGGPKKTSERIRPLIGKGYLIKESGGYISNGQGVAVSYRLSLPEWGEFGGPER